MEINDQALEKALLIKAISTEMARAVTSTADQTQIQDLVNQLPNVKYSSSILFAAFLLRYLSTDIQNDHSRPPEMTPDLVLPIIAATILQIAEHMQLIPVPNDPKDLN